MLNCAKSDSFDGISQKELLKTNKEVKASAFNDKVCHGYRIILDV